MAKLTRTHDWARTPLGPVEMWPASLRSTIDLMLDAEAQIVLFWGPEFIALYNDAYAPTIGDKHPRALGRPARESWTELWDDLEPLLRNVFETGETFAARERPFYIERHGFGETVYFDVSYSAVRDPDGSVAGVLCIVAEVTARVLAASALGQSEARLALAVDIGGLGHWELDLKTFTLTSSELCRRNFGRAVDEPFTYEDLRDSIHPDDRERQSSAVAAAIGTRSSFEIVYRALTPAGGIRWIEVRGRFEGDPCGDRLVGVSLDVTESKRAEQALRENQERLKVLVAELQHRTRNLMTVVRSVAKKSRRESGSSDDFAEVLLDRLDALSRAQNLLSRRAEGTKVVFDQLLRAELAAYMSLDDPHSKVEFHGPAGIRLPSKSVQTLTLAIHELTTNAVKYGALSQPRGRLRVSWHVEPAQEKKPSRLFIDWRERDVAMPPADGPARAGYGRELIERALPYQLSANTIYSLEAGGVHCTIALPIAAAGAREAGS